MKHVVVYSTLLVWMFVQAAPLDAHAGESFGDRPRNFLAMILFASKCLEKKDAWIGRILFDIDHIV